MFLKRPTHLSPEDRRTFTLALRLAKQVIQEKRARGKSIRLPLNELETLLIIAVHGGRRLERDSVLSYVASQLTGDEKRALAAVAKTIFPEK